jgi:hypothetical protein
MPWLLVVNRHQTLVISKIQTLCLLRLSKSLYLVLLNSASRCFVMKLLNQPLNHSTKSTLNIYQAPMGNVYK